MSMLAIENDMININNLCSCSRKCTLQAIAINAWKYILSCFQRFCAMYLILMHCIQYIGNVQAFAIVVDYICFYSM